LMIWREIKVRYKQTAIGVGWAVLQPLITMVIFTVVFGTFAQLPSDGVPYPVFSFAALLPWVYFSQALTRGSGGLVGHANLLTKVYFPRLIIPIAGVIAPIIDFFVSFWILLALMLWFGLTPTWGMLALPLFLSVALLSALSVSLWVGPINVKYRDVGHTIPFFIQVWMYASPVAYPVSIIPEKWRLLYSLNPMVGVIEGFRWALFGRGNPDFTALAASGCVVMTLVLGGMMYFKSRQKTFSDVV